jgi:hypothetical protein
MLRKGFVKGVDGSDKQVAICVYVAAYYRHSDDHLKVHHRMASEKEKKEIQLLWETKRLDLDEEVKVYREDHELLESMSDYKLVATHC